jgi:tetratricopeptide (TPR) repeat protein
MKWFKRILLGILIFPIITVIVICIIYRPLYHGLRYTCGVQLLWFGHEEQGNRMIDASLKSMKKNATDEMWRVASIQNTKNGNYDEAIQYLDEAVKLNPKEVSGYYGWVLLHYYRDYKKALPLLHNYNSYTPSFVDYVGDDNIYYAIGICHKQLGNLDSALIYLNKALDDELSQHDESWINHRIFFHKARVHHLRNELDSAIIYYDKTLSVWDSASESYFFKGLLFNEIDQLDSSCLYFNKAYDLVRKGYKTEEGYVLEFDEIFKEQVLDTINFYCKNL